MSEQPKPGSEEWGHEFVADRAENEFGEIEDLGKLAREAFAAGAASRWTYVEDGLPEEHDYWLVATPEHLTPVRALFYPESNGWYHAGYKLERVYAWAPLPELPEVREMSKPEEVPNE